MSEQFLKQRLIDAMAELRDDENEDELLSRQKRKPHIYALLDIIDLLIEYCHEEAFEKMQALEHELDMGR